MKPFLDRILDYYHLSYDDYLKLTAEVTEENFAMGHKFDKIDEIVDFIYSFVKNNKKIFIYGDYDADGIMGTSILTKMFSYKDYIVDYYVPNRYQDGYGLTLKKAREFVENNLSE